MSVKKGTKLGKNHWVKDGRKWCKGCERELPIADFVKAGAGYNPLCKVCYNKSKNSQDEETKSKRLFNLRLAAIKHYHGHVFTAEEIIEIKRDLAKGKCEICGNMYPNSELCIDHDHVSGRYRGVLCKMCNLMIGSSLDFPERLLGGAMYLYQKRIKISHLSTPEIVEKPDRDANVLSGN
jgi:hypothetical protein